jgi:hypothetical protein
VTILRHQENRHAEQRPFGRVSKHAVTVVRPSTWPPRGLLRGCDFFDLPGGAVMIL